MAAALSSREGLVVASTGLTRAIASKSPVSATTVVICLSCSSLEVMSVLCPMGPMTLPERLQPLKGAYVYRWPQRQHPENGCLKGGAGIGKYDAEMGHRFNAGDR